MFECTRSPSMDMLRSSFRGVLATVSYADRFTGVSICKGLRCGVDGNSSNGAWEFVARVSSTPELPRILVVIPISPISFRSRSTVSRTLVAISSIRPKYPSASARASARSVACVCRALVVPHKSSIETCPALFICTTHKSVSVYYIRSKNVNFHIHIYTYLYIHIKNIYTHTHTHTHTYIYIYIYIYIIV